MSPFATRFYSHAAAGSPSRVTTSAVRSPYASGVGELPRPIDHSNEHVASSAYYSTIVNAPTTVHPADKASYSSTVSSLKGT